MKTSKFLAAIIIMLLFVVASSIIPGCNMFGVYGNGNIILQERSVTPFHSIDVSGYFEVEIKQGEKEAVVVEADENLTEHIITKVKGDVLEIYSDKNIRKSKALRVYITFVTLKSIDMSGAVQLNSTERVRFDDFSLDASGASETHLDMTARHVGIDLSGGSKITMEGECVELSIDASGASNIYAYDLLANKVDISMSGAGEAGVYAKEKLNATVSGAGKVVYKGKPVVSQNVSGAASIYPAGEE